MRGEESTSEKDRLERELEGADRELVDLERVLESKADYDLGEGDPSIYEWELNLARREELREKIRSFKAALERVEGGSYGICEVCGERIDPERLQILPQTALCVRCARRQSS